MTLHFIETTQTSEGWQSAFAFQVFHRPAKEWKEMRWGFNTGVLLEEALDRNRLFLESQAVNETVFFEDTTPTRTLAIRGINLPGSGLQMAVLGKVTAPDKTEAEQGGQSYAREVFSTFPHDFILKPTASKPEFDRLTGNALLLNNPSVVCIQRENTFIPPMRGFHYLNGFWQASTRSNEQIWRAMFGMDKMLAFNVLLQPTILFEDEKELLLEIKKKVLDSKDKPDIFLPYYPWVESYIKRRLAPWKKFFLLQVHVIAEGTVDENIARTIGSAMTRESNDTPLPGFHVTRPNTADEETEWCEDIRLLNLIPPQRRMDDLADVEEAFSVFRLPLPHELGLPGAGFIEPSNVV